MTDNTKRSTGETTDGPVVIHEWPLASNMIVRATLGKYHGRKILDLRKHYEAADGCFMPTRKGLALEFSGENVAELEKAVKVARKELQKENAEASDGTK